jgi:asparagine synthase (glutamine-hydrolysing)
VAPIAALVAWGQGARPGVPEVELGAALGPAAAAAGGASVEAVPGALLACAGPPRAHVAVDAEGRVAVAADARLDGRVELAARLGLPAGAPAPALILAAYREWGDGFAARLQGDFAGAVWDWGRQRLVGFRDPLGARPLYYGAREGGLAVASDVEPLVALARAGDPDDHLIVEHLAWEYESTDRTFWAGLRRLHGGHLVVVTADGERTRRTWFPPSRDAAFATTEAAHERLRELFFQSVRRRLQADGPLLAHLSGGVDSSSIVCVADRIYREAPAGLPPLTAVSARYPGLACDEGPYIEAVARAVSLPAESWDGLRADFPDIDAPSAAGPGMRSHRNDGSTGEFDIAARLGARAILSGQGGDHLGAPFGVNEERARRRPLRFAWRTLAAPEYTRGQRATRARFLLRVLAPTPARRLVASRRARRAAPDWLQPRWHELAGELAAARFVPLAAPARSLVEDAHWRELTSARLGRALDLDQRCAAEHGLEMRFPFLDRDLVELVLALPVERWPLAESHIRLHREAFGDLLPEAVRARTDKAAFSPVVAHRLRAAAPRLRRLFFDGEWASSRWVERGAARRLLERALAGGGTDFALWQPVWAIATLEAWRRSEFGYDPRPRRGD